MIWFALALIPTALSCLMSWYCFGASMSPDDRYYTNRAKGFQVPFPYNLRPLIPILLRANTERWKFLSTTSLIALGPAVAWAATGYGLSPVQGFVAACLVAALPGSFRLSARFPVLVDPAAMLLTVISAGLALHGHPIPAAAVALLGATVKETVPLFAAAASACLCPLFGLAAVPICWLLNPPAEPDQDWLRKPLSGAWEHHRLAWFDWSVMLAPWGLCLAGLLKPTLAVWLSLGLGYGSMFTAMDTARLYQWGFLPLAAAAATVIPLAWAPLAITVHWFSPWGKARP